MIQLGLLGHLLSSFLKCEVTHDFLEDDFRYIAGIVGCHPHRTAELDLKPRVLEA